MIAVGATMDDLARAREIGQHAQGALEAQGETVLSIDRAIARADSGPTQPFVRAPEALAGRVAVATEAVLEHVAFGRNDRAIEAGEPVLADVEAYIVGLGRMDAATDVANLCMYLVRAELQARRTERAHERAETCIRLVPTLVVDERLHPPAVVQLVSSLRASLDAGDRGAVASIQSTATDPEGCSIRVNGSVVGETPAVRIPLLLGNYGVQVECIAGQPGRVTRFEVVRTGEPVRISVASRLATILRTDAAVSLVYASAPEIEEHLATDVASLGGVLEVDRVLAVIVVSGVPTIRAFELTGDVNARLVGAARLPVGPDEAASRAAIASVRGGRTELGDPSVPAPDRGADASIHPAGPVLLGVGGALLVASAILGGVTLAEDSSLTMRCLDSICPEDARGQVDQVAAMALATDILWISGAAVAIAGAAMTLFLRDERTVTPQMSASCGPHGCALHVRGGF